MLADRTIGESPAQVIDFLGTPALFPSGPMRLAAALRRPVIFMTALYRGGNRYHVVFRADRRLLAALDRGSRGGGARGDRALRGPPGAVLPLGSLQLVQLLRLLAGLPAPPAPPGTSLRNSLPCSESAIDRALRPARGCGTEAASRGVKSRICRGDGPACRAQARPRAIHRSPELAVLKQPLNSSRRTGVRGTRPAGEAHAGAQGRDAGARSRRAHRPARAPPVRRARSVMRPQVVPFVESVRATLAGDRAALERYFTVRLHRRCWRTGRSTLGRATPRSPSPCARSVSRARAMPSSTVAIRESDGDGSLLSIGPESASMSRAGLAGGRSYGHCCAWSAAAIAARTTLHH